ncbi:helix-turn-helix domain containing protein [Amycolatopsis cynarae]|uniref:Helix-turn-helix domain containing protein n=1 Tax=Amycolatopsis cynarae TaxID=2995223 RepID=A0ABY7B9C0_9PSEU|nr:TetR/AcrR family transcriptional regulator [Amycolatopsis sp. HUAS 11-8]WAL67753.1 helix-turn-helix domain containing protein [Amycolatopsis sp. HUAS 11-8]
MARVLTAAEALFADTDTPGSVTMDAIATAAGIGKGTLFRAFGSRDGLLDALSDAKFTPVRQAAEGRQPPLGSDAPTRERIIAFLDAVLTFKLNNRHLIRAREVTSTGALRTERYLWMQDTLRTLIADAMPAATGGDAGYTAHALLAAIHIDLVEELLASGRTPEQIRHSQAAFARAVITVTPR